MPRTYKRTTDYGLISHDAMMEAVELVMGVMSVRKVAQEKGLSKSSLSRYVHKHKENPTAVLAPNYSHCQTFTTEQETQLEPRGLFNPKFNRENQYGSCSVKQVKNEICL